MLLWIAQAVMKVGLCGSSGSMFWLIPILIVPPDLGFWACALPGTPRGSPPATPSADHPSARRTDRRVTSSSRVRLLTTSNPSRLFMLDLLACTGDRPRRGPAPPPGARVPRLDRARSGRDTGSPTRPPPPTRAGWAALPREAGP